MNLHQSIHHPFWMTWYMQQQLQHMRYTYTINIRFNIYKQHMQLHSHAPNQVIIWRDTKEAVLKGEIHHPPSTSYSTSINLIYHFYPYIDSYKKLQKYTPIGMQSLNDLYGALGDIFILKVTYCPNQENGFTTGDKKT